LDVCWIMITFYLLPGVWSEIKLDQSPSEVKTPFTVNSRLNINSLYVTSLTLKEFLWSSKH
uniref:Leptin receptor n=1 Tax=Sparus aurata TaxID=8175 RepID=A0A671WUF3_SPAAU